MASVYAQQIVFYGSAFMPEADNSTVGGAIDKTKRISYSDLTVLSAMDVVSSSASDTATKVTYYGRNTTGAIVNQTLTLNGRTKVPGSFTLGRLLYGATSGAAIGGPVTNPGGTPAVGDVALMQNTLTISAHNAQGAINSGGVNPPLISLQPGDGASVSIGMIIRTTGGTGPHQIRTIRSLSGLGVGSYGVDVVALNRDWDVVPDGTTIYEVAPGFLFEILPNPVTCITRPFANVASAIVGGDTRIYYEKAFVLNTDTVTSLTVATVTKQADPLGLYSNGGALDFALCTALNDTATATNRQTLPTGIGSWSSGAAGQTISVPAPGDLPAGNAAAQAQGVWFRLTLPAGLPPSNAYFSVRPTGTTT